MIGQDDSKNMKKLPTFGERLDSTVKHFGPLCVGIDPHRTLLQDWGYSVSAEGAELFSMRLLQATGGKAGVVKFQSSMFERYGSKGYEALERVLYAARQMGVITIIDNMRGGLPTTISALADAYFHEDSPLLADAITLLPYYGARSLRGLINEALEYQRGVFIASLTSNVEGANLQTSIRQHGDFAGKTVAYGIASTVQQFNENCETLGSVGLLIGATSGSWLERSGLNPRTFTGPILAPGYGWQGAQASDLKNLFAGTQGNVLVPVSRFIAVHGPNIADLSAAIERVAHDIKTALLEE